MVIERARERVGVAENKQRIAGDELKEAQRALDSAASELQLAAQRAPLPEANPRNRVTVLRARQDYAARLVDERRSRFAQAAAELRVATVELRAAELDVAQRAGRVGGMQGNAILEERQDAHRRLTAAQAATTLRAGELAVARDRWDQVQRQYETATRM